MPWCPKCKAEYREEMERCSDCDIELMEELKEEKIHYDEETFLMSTSDEIKANDIESLLKVHGIPVLKKHRGSGGYLQIYMGISNTGIDIFVPSRALEEAKEIMKQNSLDIRVEVDSIESFDDKYNKKRRIKTWIILSWLVVPVILWIVYNLLRLLIK